jgi:hypothetical protein
MALNILEHVRGLLRRGVQLGDAVDRTAAKFKLGGTRRVDLLCEFI